MKEILTKKNVVLIFLGIGLIIFLTIIVKNRIDKSGQNAATDDISFNMIDPDNPTTTRDNISRIKRQVDNLKSEDCINNALVNHVQNKATEIKAALNWKSLSNSELKGVLENYKVSKVFDFDWKVSYCGNTPTGNQAGFYNTPSYSLYALASLTYRNLLSARLNAAGAPPNVSRYLLYYARLNYDDFFDSYPSYDFDTTVNIIDTSLKGDFIGLEARAGGVFDTLANRLIARERELSLSIKNEEAQYKLEVEKYSKSRLDINDKAISYGIVAFVIIALVMYIYGIYSRNQMREKAMSLGKTETSDDFKTSMWYSVYVITVLLLIITIFILGLGGILKEESLAALLGGIAGYVLNSKQSDSYTAPQKTQS